MYLQNQSDLIFDTNIFNLILDEGMVIENLNIKVFVSEVQFKEIMKTKSDERRIQLLKIYQQINPTIILSKTSLWGDFPWGEKTFGKVTMEFKRILDSLNESKRKKNNSYDSLIAEVAIQYKLLLVTNVIELIKVFRKFKFNVITFRMFKKYINSKTNA